VLLTGLAVLVLVEQLVRLQLGAARLHDDVGLEVEDPLEIAHRYVEELPDAAGQPLEEPHVADGCRQLDVAHALAADAGLGDLDAALVADHAAVLHALVLAAQALPVGDRAENLGAEQAVAFRLEGPVVDRLRLGDLAERPLPDLVRRRQADADGVEVGRQCARALGKGSHVVSLRTQPATGAGAQAGGAGGRSATRRLVLIRSTSRHSAWSSRMSTLNDSGSPGVKL